MIRQGLVGVQYIKVLKEYIFVYSFPSLLLLGFIFSSLEQFELGSQTRDQSDHLALAPAVAFFLVYNVTFFVWKSSVLNSNSNGNIFGLLYLSYLYFEWVKIASLCQCFCVFIFLSCAAKNSPCHLGISRLLLCRFRGHDMTNKEYALRRGVQWTFSIHSAYLLTNQSQKQEIKWECMNILQVPDTGKRVLDNTRPFLRSSIVSFWIKNVNITFSGNTGTPVMFQYSPILGRSSIWDLKYTFPTVFLLLSC